ncbi:TPA: DNA repair protein [Serratia marcescens]|uniref:P-loop ATPase, Sll1717 family n=1 Tax=Serratia marcescens TaxID=615 RepID=UPI000F7E9F77|nr:DNA repair protein [Serratia marcescens]NCI52361.1 DNA repair protein [Serratia marcescens]NDJ04967.1 DNA repair protein [Serratia marcescens]NDJ28913.1 DNA repair protein [Serratia marcescens]NDJ42461.1 DNA repair protein [Serratia marcescens]NDJ46864.1 DNA repair protein [Serratia marcescens]
MEKYIFKNSDQIGSLDAETDTFLEECFVESSMYDVLKKFTRDIDFTKRIIVGRTGSGKTALLKKLMQDNSIKKHAIIEAESTVFEHIKNNIFISQLLEKNIDLRVFYKSLWIHVLLVKVIEITFPNNASFYDKIQSLVGGKKKKYNIELAQEYLAKYSDNFFNDKIVSEITEKMQSELSGSLGGSFAKASGKLTDEVAQKIQTETARYVSSELLRKQKELIKIITEETADEAQNRVIISIDDLDKSWLSSSNIRYDFINALLDAFKELIDIRSVKVLISIRTDILMGIYKTNLRQEEKDRSLIIPIEWKRKDIFDILDKRINYLIKHKYAGKTNVHFSDVFNFSVKDESAANYIVERTMLRPRDAIDFVNFCLSQGDGVSSLNEDNVFEAEEKYYNSRKNAINKEWLSRYKHINDYTDCIALINKKEFTKSDIVSDTNMIIDFLMSRSTSEDDINDEKIATDFNALLDVWFTIGLIGIKKSDTLIVFSSFDKPSLDISDYNKTFLIHPLFYRV